MTYSPLVLADRDGHTDFGMGGGDKGPMGGDWRVIRDKINGTKKSSLNI